MIRARQRNLRTKKRMSQPNSTAVSPTEREDPKPAKLWSLAAGAASAVVIAAALGWFTFLFVLDTYKLVPSEAARTAVTLLGVPTAAGAVFVALRNLRLKERQLHTDQLRLADAAATFDLAFESEHNRRDVEQERELRARYVSAADQIGSVSAAVRLAGVNAMAQLADDWTEQRQACVDVLCAYLRLPQMRDDATGGPSLADGEVRRTVQRLIARGFKRIGGTDGKPRWPDLELDLRGASLFNCHMPRIVVEKASFVDAQFRGSTTFIGSSFTDAAFAGAQFSRAVTFSGCDFRRVSFMGATFISQARFKRAVFTGMANFNQTTFLSGLEISGVKSKRIISFRAAEFWEQPPVSAEGYKLLLHKCLVNGSPIPDLNYKSSSVPSDVEDDDDFDGTEEGLVSERSSEEA